jgi:hypothetical protein
VLTIERFALGVLAVFARHNITGGVNQLMPIGGGEPFFTIALLLSRGRRSDRYGDQPHKADYTGAAAAATLRGERGPVVFVKERGECCVGSRRPCPTSGCPACTTRSAAGHRPYWTPASRTAGRAATRSPRITTH